MPKVNRPRDVPKRKGKYRRQDLSTDKKSLSNEAKALKRNGSISDYKIVKYNNVKMRSAPFGKLKPKTLYALFVKTGKRSGGLF